MIIIPVHYNYQSDVVKKHDISGFDTHNQVLLAELVVKSNL